MDNSVCIPIRGRIERIYLQNFKGVSEGTIEFNCLKNPFEQEIQSDILGVYGQNGSGKTTLLEALHLAKLLMMGRRIPEDEYADIIAQGAENARMELTFQFVNPDESIYHVEYAFSIAYRAIPQDEESKLRNIITHQNTASVALASAAALVPNPASVALASAALGVAIAKNRKENIKENKKRLIVYDEVISISGCFNGVDYRFAPIFDTRTEEYAFIPKAKHSEFFPENTASVVKDLNRYKQRAKLSSVSFIFTEVIQLIIEQINHRSVTPFGLLLYILNIHATQEIRILDSIVVGASKHQNVVLYTAFRGVRINLNDSTTLLDEDGINTLRIAIEGLNVILKQLIPELIIEAVEQVDVDISNSSVAHSSPKKKITVYSVREGIRIPLAHESTGILRLISTLGLMAYAFSNPRVTVAIDEIDAGVYEYLLGELLEIFEEYGRGQLIFTCHNLRPMEVLNKKFICFTTTNQYNRYLRLKNIRKDKNLRDAYLKEIKDCNQDEELYSSAKIGKIASAMQKAGEILAKEA